MKTNIIASFDYVNATKGWRIGEDEPQETRFETTGELFKFCLKEYGRCASKMYITTKDSQDKYIGWVFEKNVSYTDCDEKYLQETWVTVHDALPERKVTYHYASL